MRSVFCFLVLICISAACKPKVLSGKDLENKLKETMQVYLDNKPHPDVVFAVQTVTYFPRPEKKDYICEFNVQMHYQNKDTTGIMKAVISNDFKKVERSQ